MKLKLPDERAHQFVQEILDGAEDRLVRRKACEPEDATDYLTVAYIRQCESLIEHAIVYLPNEERLAADIFLYHAASAAQKRRLNARMSMKCALQLQNNTLMYLPNYHRLLRLALAHILATRTTTSELLRSGVLLLAIGTLPGALTDMRRELRRRGYDRERTLICEDDLKRRMTNIAEQQRVHRFGQAINWGGPLVELA